MVGWFDNAHIVIRLEQFMCRTNVPFAYLLSIFLSH